VSGVGNILIKVGAQTADAVRELGKVDKALGDTMTRSEKMGAGLKKAALPAAAALGAIGFAAIGATKAALEDAAAQDKLAGVLERTTGATQAQLAAASAYVDKMALATGVADDQLRPALAKLASATGDIGKAQSDLALALDVSAASGKSVEQVAAAMAKGYDGSVGALQKMIPGLKDATGASKDMTVVQAELARMTGGAASDAANTAAGQFKIFQLQMAELQETLGAALIPVIEALMPLLRGAASLAAANTTAIKVLVGIVASLAAGILIANGVMKAYAAVQTLIKVATAAWSVAQYALNVALTANPIGLIIVAVAALTAGVIIAYKKSETFREIVDRLWGVFKRYTVLGQVISHFDSIRAVIERVVGVMQSAIGYAQSLIDTLSRIKVPSLGGIVGGLIPGRSGGSPDGRSAAGFYSAPRSAVGGITVNVYGPVDPEGTARALQRVLVGHSRRQGGLA
jgi:HPt (histidine-containing phosphotransfer) domain-containing protein